MNRLSLGERAAAALAGLAILGAFVAGRIPRETLAAQPLCWSVVLLGRECAGCGLTRSFAALGRLGFSEANLLNPLGPVLLLWAVAILAVRAGRVAAPRFRYWFEIDLASAAVVALSVATRLVTYYWS